jgi:hypothetical protein
VAEAALFRRDGGFERLPGLLVVGVGRCDPEPSGDPVDVRVDGEDDMRR